jgi:hypothetical protein
MLPSTLFMLRPFIDFILSGIYSLSFSVSFLSSGGKVEVEARWALFAGQKRGEKG